MTIAFKRLCEGAVIPSRAHEGDSGMDLSAAETYSIARNGGRHTFHTGIAAEIPPGHELQVRPRSGLASKHGVFAMFGTVDQGYRGEIMVTLVNSGREHYQVVKGDRIAQLVLAPVVLADIEELGSDARMSDTDRGADGFGSSGK